MENLSALKLFNPVMKKDAQQTRQTAGAASSPDQTQQADKNDGPGGFEDVFRSYLDKSSDSQPKKTDGNTAMKTDSSSDASQAQNGQKAQPVQAVASSGTDSSDSGQETPQQVIDRLNIPQAEKDELKKMLSEVDSQDSADAFVQALLASMQTAAMTYGQVEKTLSDLATSLMTEQKPEAVMPKSGETALLTATLDEIVELNNKQADPKAVFTLNTVPVQTTAPAAAPTDAKADPVAVQTAQTAKVGAAAVTADKTAEAVKDAGQNDAETALRPDQIKTNPRLAMERQQEAMTVKADVKPGIDLKTSQTAEQVLAQAGVKAAQPSDAGAAAAKAALSATAAVLTLGGKNDSADSAKSTDSDVKVVEMPKRDDDTSDSKKTDNGGGHQGDFTAKTPVTEKVVTTEMKMDKPQDVAKFAELVEIAKNQNASKISVQLHPQELGKVNIELTEHAGKITGKVTFDNEAARNLFASGADGLKQQLADKGIVIDNLEFLFKDMDHHQFAGWEGRQKKGSGRAGGSEAHNGAEEEASGKKDDSIIYA